MIKYLRLITEDSCWRLELENVQLAGLANIEIIYFAKPNIGLQLL